MPAFNTLLLLLLEGNGSERVKCWVRRGYHYYNNRHTREGGWDELAEFVQNDTQLSGEEIQSTTSGVVTVYNGEQLWLAIENLIVKLQTCCRGRLVCQEFNSTVSFLKKRVPAITYAVTRMYQDRRQYRDHPQYFRDYTKSLKPHLGIPLLLEQFSRGVHGQNAQRQIVALVANGSTDDKLLDVKTNPVDIYKPRVTRMGSRSAVASDFSNPVSCHSKNGGLQYVSDV